MIKYIKDKTNEYINIDEDSWIYYMYKYNICVLCFDSIKGYCMKW